MFIFNILILKKIHIKLKFNTNFMALGTYFGIGVIYKIGVFIP